jgi:hypothetical protein
MQAAGDYFCLGTRLPPHGWERTCGVESLSKVADWRAKSKITVN